MSRKNRYEYTDWKGLGNRVKSYREQIGITKEKFAEMINRTENYLSELEKGNRSCSVHEIINRCNEEELNVLKDVIVAIYPDLNKILKKNK